MRCQREREPAITDLQTSLTIALLLTGGVGGALQAQEAPSASLITVSGTAVDSVRGGYLRDAVVSVLGTKRFADHRELLAEKGIACSMSRKGDCWDNAVAESFFATLKKQLVHGENWKTREEARAALFEYIELWYNRGRRHSSLGYLSPAEYEDMNFRTAAEPRVRQSG